MIRIHNSLTGDKQELKPVEPGHVRMYSCGMTVYDYFHVGNARMLVVFDMVSRYLRHRGLRVTYVRNITDVDDKIINRARETGVDWRAHAAKFTAAMHEDLDALGCLRPEKEPKASEYIDEMLTMIGQLIERGFAYQASNGDVHVRRAQVRAVRKTLRQEARRPARRRACRSRRRQARSHWTSCCGNRPSPASPPGLRPGAMAVPAGTSNARPCPRRSWANTSTSTAAGSISSSRTTRTRSRRPAAPPARQFAEIWMHNGFLNIDNEKMSKSLGNFFTTREVLAKIKHPEVLRFFLLSSQYRGPMNYSPDQLEQAEAGLNRLYTALRDVPEVGGVRMRRQPRREPSTRRWTMTSIRRRPSRSCRGWRASSTPRSAAARMRRWRSAARRVSCARWRACWAFCRCRRSNGSARAQPAGSTMRISRHASRRALAARKAKNWAESDRIRDELAAAGVILEDKPGGVTTWRRA